MIYKKIPSNTIFKKKYFKEILEHYKNIVGLVLEYYKDIAGLDTLLADHKVQRVKNLFHRKPKEIKCLKN